MNSQRWIMSSGRLRSRSSLSRSSSLRRHSLASSVRPTPLRSGSARVTVRMGKGARRSGICAVRMMLVSDYCTLAFSLSTMWC